MLESVIWQTGVRERYFSYKYLQSERHPRRRSNLPNAIAPNLPVIRPSRGTLLQVNSQSGQWEGCGVPQVCQLRFLQRTTRKVEPKIREAPLHASYQIRFSPQPHNERPHDLDKGL